MLPRPVRIAAACAAITLPLAACSSDQSASSAGAKKVTIAAGFYPLAWAAQQVGGDKVSVTDLTSPGVDPHEAELTPRQVASAVESDLVITQKSMQPSVDNAVATAKRVLDITQSADLATLTINTDGLTHEQEGHEHSEADGHDHAGVDPHFWLDPERYRGVIDAIATELSSIDSANTASYRANATKISQQLTALDHEYAAGLKACASRDLVTSHAAFGYLAQRYKFTQVGISGIDAESEPTPAQMARIIKYIKTNKVRTIYAEAQLPTNVADTIAREGGATVRILNPIESAPNGGADYLGLMRSNLVTLQAGQSCP